MLAGLVAIMIIGVIVAAIVAYEIGYRQG